MPFIPHTEADLKDMLAAIGAESLDALFADIPSGLRAQGIPMAEGLDEDAVCRSVEELASRNAGGKAVSFLGAGFYDRFIPKAVDALAARGEFLTAYTPYQPEVSQGTLQAIFEYQTAMCRLMQMDCANASVYDGGSALFEAVMMSVRAAKRRKIVIDEAVNPIWRSQIATYTANQQLDIVTVPHKNGMSDKDALMGSLDKTTACVVVQNPNWFGAIDDFSGLFAKAKDCGCLSVISVEPVMQSILKTPGEMGADIAVAEGQGLGMPLSFGGPYLGIMTCSQKLVRQMPGRIVGRTHDADGKTGYVLTLQAREQHIRRSKATSNICSNQALCALRALIHVALLGPEGLARSAELGMNAMRALAAELEVIPGVSRLNDAPFGSEAAFVLPCGAAGVIGKMTAQGVIPGADAGTFYKGMDNVLLVSCTEKTAPEHMRLFADLLRGAL